MDARGTCRTLRVDTRPRQQILTLIAIALTFGSGANDVASFTRLGGVFTSVMTGNIVLWGLSAAERSVSLFSHTAVSIAGYIIGVACGTWVAHGFKVRGAGKPEEQDRDSVLPGHVSWALFTELVLLAGFTAGWEITAARRPAGRSSSCSRCWRRRWACSRQRSTRWGSPTCPPRSSPAP